MGEAKIDLLYRRRGEGGISTWTFIKRRAADAGVSSIVVGGTVMVRDDGPS